MPRVPVCCLAECRRQVLKYVSETVLPIPLPRFVRGEVPVSVGFMMALVRNVRGIANRSAGMGGVRVGISGSGAAWIGIGGSTRRMFCSRGARVGWAACRLSV